MIAAGGVFALASAGAAMSAAAADAMFLAEVGPAHLGTAVAGSSALLAVVLAVVGGLSDRMERRRVLAGLAAVSAIALVALALLSAVMPRLAAIATLVGGKQLAAATDLSFWVVIGERLDARRSRRMLPLLAATGGAGAVIGSLLVIPMAALLGARGVLVGAAALLALASAVTARIAATRRLATATRVTGAMIVRSWREGARAARMHPLARQLAVVVAAAGMFGALSYFALGVAVARSGHPAGPGVTDEAAAAHFAAVLGAVRGVGQGLTLGVQLVLAPRVLARLGPGHALLLAPLVAIAAGAGLVIAPLLAVAIAMQLQARVMDGGIETPAEKLAQTLLPVSVRGRVAGFLDGTAKRVGAIAGGLLAAVVGGMPAAIAVATLVAALGWLLAAARLSRTLPALAVAEVERDATDAAEAVDARTLEVLARELHGPDRARAAEVLVRLHDAGRADAVTPLARAATVARRDDGGDRAVWSALATVLDEPAREHGPALAAALGSLGTQPAPGPDVLCELAVRAVGLAGGVDAAVLSPWLVHSSPAVQLAATIAVERLRAAGWDAAHPERLELLADAVRDGAALARVAVDELTVELARARVERRTEPALATARVLVRALRRGRGDLAGRFAASTSLARLVEWQRGERSAELALLRAELVELARGHLDHAGALTGAADASEAAAAIALLAALLLGADVIEPDDLRRFTGALGEPDDAVRGAAEVALTALGATAAGELVETAAWGRRRARDRSAALLAALPITKATLDRLVEAELEELDRTHAAIAGMSAHPSGPGRAGSGGAVPDGGADALLVRRLEERLREIAHTVLLLVAARQRSPAIARAAAAWSHAHDAHERARTLAVVETALPRALVVRLVDTVDVLAAADRAALHARAGHAVPTRGEVLRLELGGRDRLSRALAVHALGAAGRGEHRGAIATAAASEALATTALSLLRRVTSAVDRPHLDGEPDMPSRVESLILLGRVPLLSALTTRQLGDLAERTRTRAVGANELVLGAGDVLDALVVVEAGELVLGDRRLGPGECVDELAPVAPRALAADLRAATATRILRLERQDFEELVDDVPGLAAAICRALGDRARGTAG